MTAEARDIQPYVRDPRGGKPGEGDPRRCTAHLSDGSGERCDRWAVKEGNTCPTHGGKSTKHIAQLKLLDLVPIATAKHKQVLEKSVDDRVVLKAIEMVYDRTGLEAKSTIVAEASVVREMVVSRLLAMESGGVVGDSDDDEDIVDAELVDDEPDLEDLL